MPQRHPAHARPPRPGLVGDGRQAGLDLSRRRPRTRVRPRPGGPRRDRARCRRRRPPRRSPAWSPRRPPAQGRKLVRRQGHRDVVLLARRRWPPGRRRVHDPMLRRLARSAYRDRDRRQSGAMTAAELASLGSTAWNPTTAPRRKGRFLAWLPPDDRLWRHPSEAPAIHGSRRSPGAPAAGRATIATSPDGRGSAARPPVCGRVALIAGVIGAVAASGIGMMTGAFRAADHRRALGHRDRSGRDPGVRRRARRRLDQRRRRHRSVGGGHRRFHRRAGRRRDRASSSRPAIARAT